jgi:hypothetical protein
MLCGRLAVGSAPAQPSSSEPRQPVQLRPHAMLMGAAVLLSAASLVVRHVLISTAVAPTTSSLKNALGTASSSAQKPRGDSRTADPETRDPHRSVAALAQLFGLVAELRGVVAGSDTVLVVAAVVVVEGGAARARRCSKAAGEKHDTDAMLRLLLLLLSAMCA